LKSSKKGCQAAYQAANLAAQAALLIAGPAVELCAAHLNFVCQQQLVQAALVMHWALHLTHSNNGSNRAID
jgi:hypothetical protein